MKIFKGFGTGELSIFADDIEKQYLEFTSDMNNFNLCRNLIYVHIENEMLFEDIVACLNSIQDVLTPESYNLPYNELKKVINAYLSNLQPFLSALEKNIGTSDFEEITHSIYDKYTEYQFCYELRNVLQHKGFNISISIENNTCVQILVDKKDLLEDIKIKAKTRTLLSTYSEQIDLLNQLNGFHKAQCEIFKRAYLAIYNNDAHNRLLAFHIKNTDTLFLYIGDYQSGINDDGQETLKLNFLHFDRRKILENIDFYNNLAT